MTDPKADDDLKDAQILALQQRIERIASQMLALRPVITQARLCCFALGGETHLNDLRESIKTYDTAYPSFAARQLGTTNAD